MKTINKIFPILFISILLLVSCKVDVNNNSSVNGNKKVILQKRAIAETIDKIDVHEGIHVFITMGSDESLTVEADENLVDLIKTEIKDGTLKIYCEPNINKSTARNIYITTNMLIAIKTSSGAKAMSENTLLSDSMHITASSGSFIDLQVNTETLVAKSSSGSNINLKGRARNTKVVASSGSSIDAYKLISKSVDSKASSGSHIKLTATESLKGKASSGGSITHQGKAKKIEKKTTSGGSIIAK